MKNIEIIKYNLDEGRIRYNRETGYIIGVFGRPIGRVIGKGYLACNLVIPNTNRFTNIYNHHIAAYDIFGEMGLDSKYHIHHVNGDRQDNRITNLQLLPKSVHMSQHNRLNTRSARINFDIAEEIRAYYATGDYTQYDLADMFNLSQQHISDIVNKRKWSDKMRGK